MIPEIVVDLREFEDLDSHSDFGRQTQEDGLELKIGREVSKVKATKCQEMRQDLIKK